MGEIRDNIVLSTAAFCLWDISIKEKLDYAKNLGFNNVQIAFSTMKMLRNFVDNFINIRQMKEFDDVSIHAPWCGFKYGDNKKTRQALDYLKSINECNNISRFIFNHDSISDVDVLYNSGFEVIIRNPVIPDSWNKFSSTIKNKSLPCAFDLNKAIRSNYSIDLMINEIESSISEIHISGFLNGKNRMPIVSTKQDYLIKHLEKFNIKKTPIIIEGLFSPEDFHSIVKEIELIMGYYKNTDAILFQEEYAK